IVTVLPQIITGIITTLLSALPQLIEAGVKLLTALIGALPQIISTIVAALPQIIAAIVSAIGGAIPQLVMAGVELLTALITNLPQIISTIVAAIPQIITGIVGAVGQGVGQMASAGADLVRGLWNGIQSLAGWLWDRVSSWCADIWDGITGFFGINSPSKEMAWVGDMLTRGLAGGIEDTGSRAVAAAEDVAADTLAAMSELTSGIDVPITTSLEPVDLTPTHLQPPPATTSHSAVGQEAGHAGEVAGIVDQTARALLGAMDIKVVLNDGALVGKLAPGINRQLARINSHHTVLATGGGV
ncbi:TPA: phage tail protein, partial [Corynebacterium striatum]|nr:phage tail protein [Corynebacterium striatum]HAT6417478.1 phage tail protein [Corynebacterium striatum]HAT6613636.1 phage tail protein [Corynebacterium striatum]HAT6628971.1 phage tail protein [Corynebacterium striatum]HAT6646709.1 phage tail protein [Corynebacterium striatum]